MHSLFRTLRRITGDIVSGKNLETYAITVAAFGMIIFTIIEDATSTDAQLAVILAAVGYLVFKTTSPKDTENVDLDNILQDRQSYGPFRDFIRGGRELWIYAPSAVNVLTSAAEIEREILDQRGSMRVLVQDPKRQDSIAILRKQLDQMGSHLLEQDIERSISILNSLKQRSQNVDYRMLAYSPGFSLVVVDPDGRDGRLVVEFFGFGNERIIDRMHIVITRQQSHYWFEYWAAQFQQMWEVAGQQQPVAN